MFNHAKLSIVPNKFAFICDCSRSQPGNCTVLTGCMTVQHLLIFSSRYDFFFTTSQHADLFIIYNATILQPFEGRLTIHSPFWATASQSEHCFKRCERSCQRSLFARVLCLGSQRCLKPMGGVKMDPVVLLLNDETLAASQLHFWWQWDACIHD